MRGFWHRSLIWFLLVTLLLPVLAKPVAAMPQQVPLPVRPVVFVHGYCGHASCWDEVTSIKSRLQKDYGYDPSLLHAFVYPTDAQGKELNREDIALIAHKLMLDLADIRQRTGADKVDIVAHSMGGLITRYYMGCHNPDTYGTVYQNDIGRFIEIASPNKGSPWASAKSSLWDLPSRWQLVVYALYTAFCTGRDQEGGCCYLAPTDVAVQQMAPDSDFLRQLNVATNSPAEVEYYPIYGQIIATAEVNLFGSHMPIEQGLGDLVVSVESAATIAGIGDLQNQNAANYHLNGFITNVPLEVRWEPGKALPRLLGEGSPYPWDEIRHGGLVKSENVTCLVDHILRSAPGTTPPPCPTPTQPVIEVVETSAALVFVLPESILENDAIIVSKFILTKAAGYAVGKALGALTTNLFGRLGSWIFAFFTMMPGVGVETHLDLVSIQGDGLDERLETYSNTPVAPAILIRPGDAFEGMPLQLTIDKKQGSVWAPISVAMVMTFDEELEVFGKYGLRPYLVLPKTPLVLTDPGDYRLTVSGWDRTRAQAYLTIRPGTPPPPPGSGGSATVLVMDISGSMGDTWQGGVKLVSAVDAASRIVRMVQHENEVIAGAHRVALVSFTTNARLDAPLTSDMDAILVQLAGYSPQARTNIGEGLQLANAQLANASPKESRIIILLSDGKTNEGLAPDQILSGPAAEAAQSGTCIYTIGFGDRGDLDEQLLQDIAAANPSCGGYYYALDYQQLLQVYVRLRHISTGDLLAEQEGTIAQGQIVNLAQFEVPAGRGELHVTLDWPGSTLTLLLTDPRGRTVDQNYPGARIFQEAASVYALIQNPQPGTWQWSVQGLDVPEGTTSFFAAVSVRGTVVPPGGGGGSGFFIVLLVAAVLVVAIFALVRRRAAPALPTAALYVTAGPANQPAFSLPDGLYTVGRDPGCHIVLADPGVSHQHAQLYVAAGTCYLADLNSANGTSVNQMYLPPLQWQMLRDGDVIQMGGSMLTFRQTRP